MISADITVSDVSIVEPLQHLHQLMKVAATHPFREERSWRGVQQV